MPLSGTYQRGVLLVFGSAAVWSFGGAIARFLSVTDSWAIIFWRSLCAALALLGFMLWREGPRGTRAMILAMGWPGVAVGCCFATASAGFVVALSYTSVAKVLLMQAGAPLVAALMTFVLFGERIAGATWLAIGAVLLGVLVMVSDALQGHISPVGDTVALVIALAFSCAIVLTRRHAHVAMLPAVFLSTAIACVLGAVLAESLPVSPRDGFLLFVFGALNLALGMALFVSGVRLLPAALAALIGTAEPVLGPFWVWLVHGEVPAARTLMGGVIVIVALLAHLAWQFRQRDASPAVPNVD